MPCELQPSPSKARRARFKVLGLKCGEQPKGQTVDASCRNPLCAAKDHVFLRAWASIKGDDGKASSVLKRLGEMEMETYFDLPEWPHEDVPRLRSAIAVMSKSVRCIVRMLPTGGIRLIRTGTFGSFYYGTKDIRSAICYRNFMHPPKENTGLPNVWLGMLWGTWDVPRDERENRFFRCNEKGCAFPRLAGANVCRSHWAWRTATVSFPREQKIDRYDIKAKASDDKAITTLHPHFHTGWLGEDKYNFLRTTTQNSGAYFVSKSHMEKENDKWWKDNVIDKGIEAPGVMVRKTSKEIAAEMEHLIETSLANYSAHQSEANMKAFWRVRKDPKPLHDDPFHPNAPRLKIGVGAHVSLHGKMRRGGGHGQGIRKKQRKRAAGWTSSRHNHDPQYFTRESVRGMGYEDFDLSAMPEEGFYEEKCI